MRRVVITGMGIVSSIGNNTQEVLASLHEAKSGITRADKYAELGFRSQVQGAPTLDPAGVDRPPRDALPRRRRRLESRRDGAGDPGFRPRAHGRFQRPHRHHHGLRRTLGAHHRGGRRHHPHQGAEAGRTVRGAEGDVVHGVGNARHLVQDQGRELFDLVGLRHLEPLHRQCLRDHPDRQAGYHLRRRLRGTRLVAVGAVRRDGRDVVEIQRYARDRFAALRRQPRRFRDRRRRRRGGAGRTRARQGARRQDLRRNRRLWRDLRRLRHGRARPARAPSAA